MRHYVTIHIWKNEKFRNEFGKGELQPIFSVFEQNVKKVFHFNFNELKFGL